MMRVFRNIPPLHDLLSGILTFGDLLAVFTQTIIVGVMPLVLLALLLMVEHMAVSDGVALFLTNSDAISKAAFVIVGLNFCAEFWGVYADNREQDKRTKYKAKKRRKSSLRIMLRGVAYWLGIGKKWKEQEELPSAIFYSLQRTITGAMLALALIGRMHTAIDKVSGVAWQQGLINLATQSSLMDIAGWVGGILLTYATIRGAQRLTYYTAIRVVDIWQTLKNRKQNRQLATRKPSAVQDAFDIEKVRDNRLAPIRIADKYQCPECGKVMSKQGWSKHPCRFDPVYVSVDHSRQLVDAVDGQLSQPEVNEEATKTTISQFSSNGHSQRGQ